MKLDKFRKARRLLASVEFRGRVGSSLYFYVRSGDRVHEVIYRIPTKKWLCDCEYFSIKARDCSHILACKMWLKRRGTSENSHKTF